jgi:hypothetical protein
MKDSLFDIRLARNCFTAAGLDFGQHFTTLVNVVDDESILRRNERAKSKRIIMLFENFSSFMVAMLAVLLIAFRCGATAVSALLRLQKSTRPYDAFLLIMSTTTITATCVFGVDVSPNTFSSMSFLIGVLSCVAHAAALIWTNDQQDFPWTRFLIKDILNSLT